jgi:hypothetical protein
MSERWGLVSEQRHLAVGGLGKRHRFRYDGGGPVVGRLRVVTGGERGLTLRAQAGRRFRLLPCRGREAGRFEVRVDGSLVEGNFSGRSLTNGVGALSVNG